jgi:hypothetical protein
VSMFMIGRRRWIHAQVKVRVWRVRVEVSCT